MATRFRHSDADQWRWMAPLETPPATLHEALATPLRDLSGCWIESQCPGCRYLKSHPVRMLQTERWERAEVPLRRAVSALSRCEKCGRDGCRLALVSDPRWRESQAAGKPPNWSLVIAGSDVGTVAFTEPY